MSKIDDVEQHAEDAAIIWEEWRKMGYDPSKPLEVNFDFYSSNKKMAYKFYELLQNESFKVEINQTKRLLVFQAWRLEASIEHTWTLDDLQTLIRGLGAMAIQNDTILEGYGALISNKNKVSAPE
jgi:hypothetical protein